MEHRAAANKNNTQESRKQTATWGKVNSRSISLNADFEIVLVEKHFHSRENYVDINITLG